MGSRRKVIKKVQSHITSDGAGVILRRSIGTEELSELDPFLLLDAFGTENPDDYIGGFPDHPHRGFETVTYMIAGTMKHRDSNGSEGLLRSGGVQWMTAGRGIIHSEMPEQSDGEMRGFQLWVNLPAEKKMMPPHYKNLEPEEIKSINTGNGIKIRIIAGSAAGIEGPISGGSVDPLYLDFDIAPGAQFDQPIPKNHTCFAYVYSGSVLISGEDISEHTLAVLGKGQTVNIFSAGFSKLILVAGKPLGEPIARYGPFVMNTPEEITQAINDFQSGNFLS